MDTQQRFDRIATYLAESFSGGNVSLSKHDVIDDDGTVLGEEVEAVLDLVRREKIVIGDGNEVVKAVETFASAWEQGFDLARGDDTVTDEATVTDIIGDYAERPPVYKAPTP